jgi:two-component system response regulator TtrR
MDSIVYVVDDHPGFRDWLQSLLQSAGMQVRAFASGTQFLENWDPAASACLVVDLHMPQMSGFDLHERLAKTGAAIPTIFVTGFGDVGTCAKAFRAGAFDFLEKPSDPAHLVGRVREALAVDTVRRRQRAPGARSAKPKATLTRRESEVMHLLVTGKSLKQVAAELDIGAQTAAKHRARVLEKLGVVNDVELVRMFLDRQALKTA